MLTFCSVATASELPSARVLAAALGRQHPQARVAVEDLEDGEDAADRLLVASRLLGRELADGAEIAVFLDPSIHVYGPLDAVLGLAGEHGVVLSPRAGLIPDDGQRPAYGDLLAAGLISESFVAVSRRPAAERFLGWWAERLAKPDGRGVRWLDLAPELFDEVGLLEDPGYNVSFWNLHERQLEHRGDGVTAAAQPLRFFDFTGFRPDRPGWLAERATRGREAEDPILRGLCADYAQALTAAGWTPPRRSLAGVQRLGNGQRVDHLVRELWQEGTSAGEQFGDPSSPADADRFVTWIREPGERGGASGVNRYLLAAYDDRPDLQRAFPDLDGNGGPGLIRWADVHGRKEVLPELLPAAAGQGRRSEADRLAVNVVGYLRDTLGVAEAARLYVDTLTAGGVRVSTTTVSLDPRAEDGRAPVVRHGRRVFEDVRGAEEPAFNLVCLNGEQLETFVRLGGERTLDGRPSIGQWAWETDALPASWLGAFRYLDEIWVNSTFVAENLARVSPVPIVVVPQGLSLPDPRGVELELDADGRFTFLFMMDFFSTLRRKNAGGLVEAFTRAFVAGEGPRLLIKTINAPFREEAANELRGRIGERPDIELADGYLDPRQKTALLARAGCYVSLHRSEGFGLTLAESMALGTPVIATGYSGNTDFMSSENSYMVNWAPTRVGPDCEIYPAHGVWAEPDLDHAAELMRRVWERPEEARVRALRARRDIQRRYGPEVAGTIARARLERLMETPSTVRAHRGGDRFGEIERELEFDVRRGAAPVPGGAAGLVRRLALRMMAPFTVHERRLDRALFEALRDLRDDFERDRELRRPGPGGGDSGSGQ